MKNRDTMDGRYHLLQEMFGEKRWVDNSAAWKVEKNHRDDQDNYFWFRIHSTD